MQLSSFCHLISSRHVVCNKQSAERAAKCPKEKMLLQNNLLWHVFFLATLFSAIYTLLEAYLCFCRVFLATGWSHKFPGFYVWYIIYGECEVMFILRANLLQWVLPCVYMFLTYFYREFPRGFERWNGIIKFFCHIISYTCIFARYLTNLRVDGRISDNICILMMKK